MAILKQGVDSSPNFVSLFQFHERLLLCTFLTQTIYTLLNRSSLKWTFLRLTSVQVKICQIYYVNFETMSWFFYKFCNILQFHERQLLYTFSAQTIYTLLKRSPLKWKFWRLTGAQVKISRFSYVNFETRSRFRSKFCIPLQFHGRLFLCSFLVQTIYALLNTSSLKWTFLILTSDQVEICLISYVNFETASPFLSKFCIPL